MKRAKTLDEAIQLLLGGGVGVLPTDTVYGLVARAADEAATKRLYTLKHREHKPGTVIAASVEQLVELGVSEPSLRRVEGLWPNSLSVIVPTDGDLEYLHQGLDSLAVRVPGDAAVRRVLEQTGPLVTSSANLPGEPPAVTLAAAERYFGDRVDFYVDGGDLSRRAPSTIVRVLGEEIEVVREGAVRIDERGLRVVEASVAGCPFCRGNGLLRGEMVAAIEGAYMFRPTDATEYFLIVPDVHVEAPADLPDTWWNEVKALLKRVPELGAHYNLSVNVGREAGQTVRHLHFWVIPRVADEPASRKGLARLIAEVNEQGK